MDEKRKAKSRPQIYDGESSGYGQELAYRRKIRAQEQKKEAAGAPEKKAMEGEAPEKTVEKISRGSFGDSERLKPLRDKLEKGTDSIRRSAESVTGSVRRREQENALKMQALIVALGVLTVLLIAAIVYEIILGNGTRETGKERMAAQNNMSQDVRTYQADTPETKTPGEGSKADTALQNTAPESVQAASPEVLQAAQRKAAQYDYDGAIELLKGTEGYAENEEYQAAVSKFEEQKAACVPYPAAEVTHVFFHTLIHDAGKAFDGDEYEAGYNQFMVTEYEFNSIIRQMYERGYVMVFLDELAPGTDDGNGNKTFAARDIMLPPDKIPFVLSQDDVSYYHYMDGDGFASRLIVDENGDVKNEYIEDDGSVSVGDYDMVPLIDRFVEEHPDFSYHGEKGYVALTGYEGILGYRTDEVYKTKEESRVTVQQQMFFDSYPGGFDEAAFEKECEGAKKVAEAMKANGWKFASHTWGHQNLSEVNGIGFDSFKRDTDRWEAWVEPLIGETDTLIYAFGGDIRDANKYSGERFDYLKQCGFDYFCGVDSAKHWLQVEPDYVRQSRRNIDGYRMFYNPDMLSDLFDVQKAWDPLRPAAVPPIKS
ncbi:MAG: polysaccharide deacetylase [Lachnospiraceae bacterium]|nr:polysaccharide deacetylase [Lachnospiraceae bacterium]